MRNRSTHLATIARRAFTATAVAALVTGGSLALSGIASAGTVLADGCSGSVSGSTGDQVAVQGRSLSGLVQNAARQKESSFLFVPLNGVDSKKLASAIADAGTLNVGEVSSSTGAVSGSAVAAAVGRALDGNAALGWSSGTKQDTLNFVKDKVAGTCGLTTQSTSGGQPSGGNNGGNENAPGAGQPGTGAGPGSTPGTSDTSGSVSLGTGSATAPPRDYGNIPAAGVPGVAVPPGAKYPAGTPIPGQAPEFGVLGADGQPQQSPDVRNAGQADVLAAPGSSSTVQLPMLLAVVALAGVTAALVRTWVLRRVSA